MNHHTDDPVCPLCEFKLKTAHPYLGEWFRRLKIKYPNSHISWAWRGQADQEAFFTAGKTRCHFPHSKHNFMKGALPYSLALDLFQLDEDGNARFSPLWYAKVNAENEADKEPIIAGITFKSIGDGDHFQLSESVPV